MTGIGAPHGGTAASSEPPTMKMVDYDAFRHPGREYGPRPFWFWIGDVTAEGVAAQIRRMRAIGYTGAYVHCRSGLKTPYLSEAWWAIMASAVRSAADEGFLLGFCDDFNWPSGEARDPLSQTGSRVLDRDPAFHFQGLAAQHQDVVGPGRVTITVPPATLFASAVRLGPPPETAADDSPLDLQPGLAGTVLSAEVPAGKWRVYWFVLEQVTGMDGGRVDLLNRRATEAFCEAVYAEYARRFPGALGRALVGSFVDHEGDITGGHVPWNPALFDGFEKARGYALGPWLPWLFEDGRPRSPQVRCDVLSWFGQAYAENFWGVLAAWAQAHGLSLTGHLWEETLHLNAANEGDYMTVQAALGMPGIDALSETGRDPRIAKETASVAHFYRRGFSVENQGVQGIDSFLSPERMKAVTNAILSFGPTLLVPHACNYDAERVDWPEDWLHQPYADQLGAYADLVARGCYLNSCGRHVCDILVYQPVESAWAGTGQYFRGDVEARQARWGNAVDALEEAYRTVQERLTSAHLDFDVVHWRALREAVLEGGMIKLGDETYRCLVLPPLTTVSIASLERALAHWEQGGIVVAMSPLPTASWEEGAPSESCERLLAELFGPGRRGHRHPRGGLSAVVGSVDALVAFLEAQGTAQLRVVEGAPEALRAHHRSDGARHYFWVVNDTPEAAMFVVDLPVVGAVEQWDPETGARGPARHARTAGGTRAWLDFARWQALVLVVDPGRAPQTVAVDAPADCKAVQVLERGPEGVTVSFDVPADGHQRALVAHDGHRHYQATVTAPHVPARTLEGPWELTVSAPQVRVPMARAYPVVDPDGPPPGPSAAGDWAWLSPETQTLRVWRVAGPYPIRDVEDLAATFPPEGAAAEEAASWRPYRAPTRVVDLQAALGLERAQGVVAYALTWVQVPQAGTYQVRVVADNNCKVVIDGVVRLDRRDRPFYLEMRESFGEVVPVAWEAGWHRLLVRVFSTLGPAAGGHMGFALRIADATGQAVRGLRTALRPDDSLAEATAEAGEAGRWYRVTTPAGCTQVDLRGWPLAAVWWDGKPCKAPWRTEPLATPGPGDLVVRTEPGTSLWEPFVFKPGPTAGRLGSWLDLGLGFFSGTVTYETTCELPARSDDLRWILDLGEVGVVAAVWVNGTPVGRRPWAPYVFDITGAARTGVNHLRVACTNTRANQRAVGDTFSLRGDPEGYPTGGVGLLERLRCSGLLGPVVLGAQSRQRVALAPAAGTQT